MAADVADALATLGVVYFGLDTICDGDGTRWLSELNTLNVGGLRGIGAATGVDLFEPAAQGLWDALDSAST